MNGSAVKSVMRHGSTARSTCHITVTFNVVLQRHANASDGRRNLVRTQRLLLQLQLSYRHFRLMQPLQQLQQQHPCRSFLHTYEGVVMHTEQHW